MSNHLESHPPSSFEPSAYEVRRTGVCGSGAGILAMGATLLLGLIGSPAANAQEAAPEDDGQAWHPEQLYGPMMAEEDEADAGSDGPRNAATGIAEWGQTAEADGESGRPLPLAASWMADKMFGPNRFVEMIENGHHVLPTFTGISFGVIRKHWQGGNALNGIIESYRPALEYAHAHNLPIVFRGWNWSHMPPKFQQLKAKNANEDIALQEDLRVIQDGKPTKLTDPFGPVEGWSAWGDMWLGNELIKRMQEIHPNPPMVIFLNNNEGPKVRSAKQIPDGYERMIEFLHGKAPANKREKERAIREGYKQRYAAMFKAAREALAEPAWKKNVKFVCYNNLWDTGYIGQGNRPRTGIWFEPEEGWLRWRMSDGGMPELYDNDWQPGKQDYGVHSPQTEAMNYQAAQPRIFERDPDFYWSTIVWEGGRVNNVFRGRRSSSKPYRYITAGQRWDFARYEGWVQFTLWTTRPRSMREFRWPPSEKHAYDHGTFMAVVRSVDRPWNHETLREFWRFGTLVPNPDESHPWRLSDDQPQWLRELDLDRWCLLTCDANPPRSEWGRSTKLRVFAQAFELGDAPNRLWLINAHAPLGAVAKPTVTLPGHGELTLPSVPKSGSFFLLHENDGVLRTLLAGGPAELALTSDKTRVKPGNNVHFEAHVAHAPNAEIRHFTWDLGNGQTRRQDTLAAIDHAFEETGTHLVTVTAHSETGERISEQVAVHVGEHPADSTQYDLPLNGAFAWEGPWGDSGDPAHELVTYRHLPNAGTLPSPVLVGGQFVEDDERGRVLELTGDQHQGIWLARNSATVMDKGGHANQTVSLRFKADDTDGRQMLYAQGYQHAGFNIYLDGDTLYAGSWATTNVGTDAGGWHPVYGRGWDGHWLTHEGLEADQWYHVVLELKNATGKVEDNKLTLRVNGEAADTGPGVRIPRHYVPPRIGQPAIPFRGPMTRYHDQGADKTPRATPFRGRLSDFQFVTEQ